MEQAWGGCITHEILLRPRFSCGYSVRIAPSGARYPGESRDPLGRVRGHAGEGQNRAAVALLRRWLLRRRGRHLRVGGRAGNGERGSGKSGEGSKHQLRPRIGCATPIFNHELTTRLLRSARRTGPAMAIALRCLTPIAAAGRRVTDRLRACRIDFGGCDMDNQELETDREESPNALTTVARSVLSTFFEELLKVEGLAEIAPKLRRVVLDDGVFAEPAVRGALFPDAP
jgi:hypothetical protein